MGVPKAMHELGIGISWDELNVLMEKKWARTGYPKGMLSDREYMRLFRIHNCTEGASGTTFNALLDLAMDDRLRK